jgi:CHAD domain-containing protein
VKSANPSRLPLASEPALDAVRADIPRLVRSAADDIAGLPDRSDERIHDIRVAMKKFRALIRLASDAIPRRKFLRLDRLAREVKDAFGAARDRDVQLGLLGDLLGDHGAAAAILDSAAPAADPPPDHSAARAVCDRLAGLADGLDLGRLKAKQVAAAWRDSYRCARRAMAACAAANFDDPRSSFHDDLHFHEWRKKVKRLLYQSVVLGPPADRMASDLARLSSELGAQHDLAVLCASLAESGHHAIHDAGAAASDEKNQAASRALVLGSDLFALKPRAMVRRLRNSL